MRLNARNIHLLPWDPERPPSVRVMLGDEILPHPGIWPASGPLVMIPVRDWNGARRVLTELRRQIPALPRTESGYRAAVRLAGELMRHEDLLAALGGGIAHITPRWLADMMAGREDATEEEIREAIGRVREFLAGGGMENLKVTHLHNLLKMALHGRVGEVITYESGSIPGTGDWSSHQAALAAARGVHLTARAFREGDEVRVEIRIATVLPPRESAELIRQIAQHLMQRAFELESAGEHGQEGG